MMDALVLPRTDQDRISDKAANNNNEVPQDKSNHASIIEDEIGNGGRIDNGDQAVNNDSDNGDEVLIMNFDEECGEDVVLPLPINESVKQEPGSEENPVVDASNRRPSLYFPIGTDSEAEHSSSELNSQENQNGNLTQIFLDNLHTSQDLDETLCNVKVEPLSQSENQTLAACTSDETQSLDNERTVVIVRSDSPNENMTSTVEGDKSMSENTLITSTKDVIISSNNSVKEHVPFEEPKTEPLDNTVITSEQEVLSTHFLLETDYCDKGNGKTRSVALPETTASSDLPYDVTLQALFTCKECGYQTSVENDLKQHLSESHMDVLPDVSALLSVDRIVETSSSSEMDNGSNVENIDCSTPPPPSTKQKVPKLILKSTLSPRTSKPNWSLQEVSDGEDEVSRKKRNTKRPKSNQKCPQCSYTAKTMHDYNMHIMFVHSTGVATVKCLKCPFTNTRFAVWKHMVDNHGETNQWGKSQKKRRKTSKRRPAKLRCQYCSFFTKYIQSYRTHLYHHENSHERVYQCPVCPAKYFKRALKQHIMKCHPPQVKENFGNGHYQCPKCNFTSTKLKQFEDHLLNNKGLDVCNPDNKTFHPEISEINDLVPHIGSVKIPPGKIRSPQKMQYKCTKCPFHTFYESVFTTHKLYHEQGIKMDKCTFCDFIGARKSMKIHIRKHSSLRSDVNQSMAIKMKGKKSATFLCYKCDFATIHMNILQKHMEANKNLTKCIHIKSRGRPINRQIPAKIQYKETVSKDKDGKEIVTIDLDADDDVELDGANNVNKTVNTLRRNSALTVTAVIEPASCGSSSSSSNTLPISNNATSINATSITLINCESDMPNASAPASATRPPPTPEFAATSPLTFKCKMCVFITNYELRIKDHINHHLLKRHHTKEKNIVFQCQKCNFKTPVDDNFAKHIAASQGQINCVENAQRCSVIVPQRTSTENCRGVLEGDVIELDDSDDEDNGNADATPLNPRTDANAAAANVPSLPGDKYKKKKKCDFCGFMSNTVAGIVNHTRILHKQEYAAKKKNENTPKTMLPPLIPLKSTAKSKTGGSSNADTASESDRESPQVLTDGNESQEYNSTNDVGKARLQRKDAPTLSDILIKRCFRCSFTTTNLKELKLHEASHNLKCQECDFETPSTLIFQGHAAIHQIRTNTPLHPPQVFQQGISTPSITVDQETSYACRECDYVTKNAVNYKAHKELHIRAMEGAKMRQLVSYNIQPAAGQNVSIAVYQCSECTYETNNNSELQIHQQVHQTPTLPSGISETPTSHYQRSENHDMRDKNHNSKKDRYYTQEKGVTSRISSDNHKKNKDKSKVDVQRKPKKKSSASESDSSDQFEPSKISLSHKKRKGEQKSPSVFKKQKRGKVCEDDTSSTQNSLSDLEDLLDEKELMSKEIKKEVMDKEDDDLEDLLDYVDISSNTIKDNVMQKEKARHLPKEIKYKTSKVVDSDSESDQPSEDDCKPKKGSSKFKCKYCKKFITNTKKSLDGHIMNIHKKSPFICQCGFITLVPTLWKNHECNEKRKLTIKANKTTKSEIVNELSPTQQQTNLFNCTKCNFKTRLKDVYLRHTKEDCTVASSSSTKPVSASESPLSPRQSKLFSCKKCDFATRFKQIYYMHTIEDCGVAEPSSSGTPKFKAKQLKTNSTSEKQSKWFRCTQCDFKTRYIEKFLFHKNEGCSNAERSSSKPVSESSKPKQPKINIISDKIVSTGLKIFSCNKCAFKTQFKNKYLAHTEEGCNDASSKTTSTSSGKPFVKMFKCPLCFYKNGYKHNVEKHFSSCHVEDSE